MNKGLHYILMEYFMNRTIWHKKSYEEFLKNSKRNYIHLLYFLCNNIFVFFFFVFSTISKQNTMDMTN